MNKYEIQVVGKHDLDELANFLNQSIEVFRDENPYGASSGKGRSPRQIQHDLRKSFEHQTQIDPNGNFGLLLRQDCKICGSLLFCTQIYRHQDRSYRALGSGSFFVNQEARIHGFFMFRKYLANQDYDFYFGNSCNPNSISLWNSCKGMTVPKSDIEYLIILRPAAIFEELILRKKRGYLKWVARAVGHFASLFVHWRGNVHMTIDRPISYEQLVEIAEQDRVPELMTAERSLEYLKWHYPSLNDTTNEDAPQVYVFSDNHGHHGWFALHFHKRGIHQQIAAVKILDVVWPHDHIAFTDVLRAIVSITDSDVDMLSLRGRPQMNLNTALPHSYCRNLPSPESVVFSRTMGIKPLSQMMDFATVDVV